jgi:DNA-binding NarL/FixJ family response regulator
MHTTVYIRKPRVNAMLTAWVRSEAPSFLVAEVERLHPDVVIVDITMPQMSGIDAVHALVQAGSGAKFVFLTIHSEEEFVKACLEEGAQGYVWKSRMKGHLIPAIHAVLDGLPYVSPLTSS